ncbi:MAG TPA: hypothetical protein VK031_06570 [Tissierellaceae bacterium]|nr:hypothetical protein [Tissierellaceae bacterium]
MKSLQVLTDMPESTQWSVDSISTSIQMSCVEKGFHFILDINTRQANLMSFDWGSIKKEILANDRIVSPKVLIQNPDGTRSEKLPDLKEYLRYNDVRHVVKNMDPNMEWAVESINWDAVSLTARDSSHVYHLYIRQDTYLRAPITWEALKSGIMDGSITKSILKVDSREDIKDLKTFLKSIK